MQRAAKRTMHYWESELGVGQPMLCGRVETDGAHWTTVVDWVECVVCLRKLALRGVIARSVGETLAALVGAYDVCDGNRGAFSCCEPHDLRCPKSRAASPTEWKGEWVCECGRAELDAALERARAHLNK